MASMDDPNFGRSTNPAVDRAELSRTVRAVILAGGEVQNPLTRYRAMPAVPLGERALALTSAGKGSGRKGGTRAALGPCNAMDEVWGPSRGRVVQKWAWPARLRAGPQAG